jgi:hypothetical protein
MLNLSVEHFISRANQQLAIGMLPPTLEILILADYNKPLVLGVLPESLKILHLGAAYNHPFEPYVLPEGLECLFVREGLQQSYLEMSVESHVRPPMLRLLDVSNASQEIKTFLRVIMRHLRRSRPNLEINFDRQPGNL